MMRYEEENERLADQSACANVRADLKMCLLESDCCKKVDITLFNKCFIIVIQFVTPSNVKLPKNV